MFSSDAVETKLQCRIISVIICKRKTITRVYYALCLLCLNSYTISYDPTHLCSPCGVSMAAAFVCILRIAVFSAPASSFLRAKPASGKRSKLKTCILHYLMNLSQRKPWLILYRLSMFRDVPFPYYDQEISYISEGGDILKYNPPPPPPRTNESSFIYCLESKF